MARVYLLAAALGTLPTLTWAMCNATNAGQWKCLTTDSTSSFQDIAQQVHLNPTKLCDWNRDEFPSCGDVPAGTALRIPDDTCQPRLGAWDCHTVVHGDTLTSIASAPSSKMRSVSVLQMINEDVLYNETTLYPGMQLRLPAFGEYVEDSPFRPDVVSYACIEDDDFECHLVSQGDDLNTIAAEYSCTAQAMLQANPRVLGTVPSVVVGMEIRVPRRQKAPPLPCQEVPGFWGCYTVQAGDSMFKIARKLGVDPYGLCRINAPQLSSCAMIEVGQKLAYLVTPACVPRPGYWNCFTVPKFADDGSPAPPLTLGFVAETANTSMIIGGLGGDLIARYNQRQICSHYDGHDCTASSEGGVEALVYPGMQLRMPVRHCFPTPDYKCLQVKDFYEDLQGLDFNQYTIANFEDNRAIAGLYISGFRTGVEIKLPTHGYPAFCRVSVCEGCAPQRGEVLCYKVQPHDTLDLIAEKQFHGGSWQELCVFNHMKNCSDLGWEDSFLRIPIGKHRAMPLFVV